MSDAENQAAKDEATPEQAGAEATQQQAAPIVVHSQYVKDLSFENPNAPMILASLKEPPKLDVRLDVGARHIQDRLFEILLKINVSAAAGENTAFVAELEYGGVASVADGIEDNQVEPLLFIEGARQIFPFARRVLADATRDGGFPPVMINAIDFAQLYRQRLQAAAEQAAVEKEESNATVN